MLTIESLCKTYSDGTEALASVSLTMDAGEIIAIVGGSGCGKTTLLRLIAGLDQATRGRIGVDGETISAPHPAIGIVFQEPRLLPWLSVSDNVGFGLAKLASDERDARVSEALARVGLGDYAERWPRELSGGQQQRVSISRSLVAKPKALLLDEPFSALDAFTRASLHEHLLALWEASRPTVLLVTHDVEEAVTLGDRVIVMRPRPGRMFRETKISMARPRDRLSPAFESAKRRVLLDLDASLKNPDALERADVAPGAALWW
ncbi:MAG: ABC transporter ATP-binding protein [Hyphomicrobiales bacterium]|nr:ABC transporter ATP-binding protein [Hyphomicrobiales bacterium]